MANTVAPGFVKLFYESPFAPHSATIPCLPYQAVGGAWFLIQANSAIGANAATLVTDYVNVLRTGVAATTTFTYAELWEQPGSEDTAVFRLLIDLNIAGNNASPVVKASQAVWSTRTSAGGNGKQMLLDTSYAINGRTLPPNYGTGSPKTIADFIQAANTWIVGRDNAHVVNVNKFLTKTNDALRKKYGMV